MSFDYDEIRIKNHSSGTQWAAYSDLFMVLAFIFLLMYMVSSLRTGMESVITHAQIEETRQELQLYKSTKDEYLRAEASPEEKRIYREVISQISLLENEAKENKDRLSKEYNEQKKLESSLNQYQKMITNMVNANAIAKADALQTIANEQQRNTKLQNQINLKKQDIRHLERKIQSEKSETFVLNQSHENEILDIEQKYKDLKTQHEDNQESMASLNDSLINETKEKTALKKLHQREKDQLQRRFDEIKELHERDQDNLASLEDTLRHKDDKVSDLISAHSEEKSTLENQIENLSNRNKGYLDKVSSLSEKLTNETRDKRQIEYTLQKETDALKDRIELSKNKQNRNKDEIASLEEKLKNSKDQKTDLENTHYDTKRDLEIKLQNLRAKDNTNKLKMASLEDDLKGKEEEDAALKIAYNETKAMMEDNIKDLKGKYDKNKRKLSSLENNNKKKVAKLNSDLSDAKQNLKNTTDNLDQAKQDLAEQSRALDKAMELQKRRKDIADRIVNNFRNNGINADVNKDTGDVTLDFGNNYFDTDSHDLKPGMKITIRKAIPVYAQSLFGSELLASLISSVEIIGFASPTYGGRPVDPTALSIENRTAVNYNLDLSYRRAKSIFEYVFDTGKIKFKHQEKMVHLINVTGRSFFTEKIDPKDSYGLTIDEFCGQYDCLKSQRVIIKFGLSEKGEV